MKNSALFLIKWMLYPFSILVNIDYPYDAKRRPLRSWEDRDPTAFIMFFVSLLAPVALLVFGTVAAFGYEESYTSATVLLALFVIHLGVGLACNTIWWRIWKDRFF